MYKSVLFLIREKVAILSREQNNFLNMYCNMLISSSFQNEIASYMLHKMRKIMGVAKSIKDFMINCLNQRSYRVINTF